MSTLYVGARSPERVDLTVTSADLDLTTVTSLELELDAPAAAGTVSWSWSIVSASASTMLLRHIFAVSGEDVPARGPYTIRGWLVSPSTRRRITPVTIVAERY
jgi:hypothetical protein